MKIQEKIEAIMLRESGMSITAIARKLNVSKSTVFGWTKHIFLSQEQRACINGNKGRNLRAYSLSIAEAAKSRERQYYDDGRDSVQLGNWEHAAGCMIWWAEGDKNRSRVTVTNADVNLLRFFVSFLKKYYGIGNDRFRLSLQYHVPNDLSLEEISEYWIRELDVLGAKLYKPYAKERKSSGTKYPFGVCRVSVYDTKLASTLWGAVQGYIGFVSSLKSYR